MRTSVFLLSFALGACVDPLVDDGIERPGLILSAGALVPDLLDADPSWRVILAANDGLRDDTTTVHVRTAFAEGQQVHYWDFGPASPTPIPLYLLVRASDTPEFKTPRGDFSATGHAPLFDSIPGDKGYSPWWTVVLLPVTERYDGELLTSFAAVEEALRNGLVSAPITLAAAVNCPVVLPEARLERPDGSLSAPKTAYYKGTVIHYFDFDLVGINPNSGQVAAPAVYELRREGSEPISEIIRAVDFTGNGDLVDTNDLFEAAPGSPAYTGLVRPIDTIIGSDLQTLDVTRSAGESALKAAADLFAYDVPDADVVVAMYPRGTVLNRPIAPLTPAVEPR